MSSRRRRELGLTEYYEHGITIMTIRDYFYVFRFHLRRIMLHVVWSQQVKRFQVSSLNDLANLSRNDVYKWFTISFRKMSPEWLKSHREYFSKKQRGYGEDAFHAMWLFILETLRPSKALEIGVYRGQIISLWKCWATNTDCQIEIVGVTPLSILGDSVSNYPELNYKLDIENNFVHFNLNLIEIIQCPSQMSPARERIIDGMWDLIYIDGSHEYEDVKLDVDAAYLGLRTNGLMVLDDSSLFTDFQIRLENISRGHPGPSLVFSEIDSRKFQWLFGVGHINVLRKL